MIRLRSVLRPSVALRATPVVGRRNVERLAVNPHMAIDPQPAVSECGLPHALCRFVKCRVDAIGVHEHANDISAGRKRAAQIVGIEALIKRAAADRPTSDPQAIDKQLITTVDRDREFCIVRLGREFDDPAEEEPPVLLIRSPWLAEIDRARSARIDFLPRRPDEGRTNLLGQMELRILRPLQARFCVRIVIVRVGLLDRDDKT